MAADWPGCRRGISTELEMTRQQLLHAALVLDDHDQVDAFDADLQAPTSTCDRKECRRAPSARGAAGSYAAAVLPTEYEAALEHMRHNSNAFCVLHHFFGYPVIRRRHDFTEHSARVIHPVVCCFAI